VSDQPIHAEKGEREDARKQGARCFGQGKFEEASKWFSAAILRGEDSELWVDWATARLACNRMAEAESGLRRALELDASNRLAGLKLGILLFNLNRHKEAVPYLEASLAGSAEPERAALVRMLADARRKAAARDCEMASRFAHPAKIIGLDYDFVPEPRYGHGKELHPELYAIIDRRREAFASFLVELQRFSQRFSEIPLERDASDDAAPFWNNPYFSWLDAMCLYGMVALRAPKRYVEIGSGNSTRFARRAIQDQKLETRIISFDPTPRAEIGRVCDRWIQSGLESVDLGVFAEVEAGDILFVDNSHRAFTNSDVTVFFLELLPRLKPGVVVHLHDIMLPADYPAEWAGRYYSEQYLLACYLLSEWPRLKILMANYFISLDRELSELATKLYKSAGFDVSHAGGSFWMEMQ